MGDRGPQPKSAELARLQGNPGSRMPDEPADTDAEFPDVLVDVPAAPPWLEGVHGDTGSLAVRAWESIAPVLISARQFREGDQVALARYCRYVAEWVGLTNEIDLDGMVITNTGPKGGESKVAHPAFRARSGVETAMAALERELGLSPRSRVEVQKRLMQALQNLPVNAGSASKKRNGPIGALTADDDEEDE